MSLEKALDITQQLLGIRKLMQRLYGPDYAKKVQPWREQFRSMTNITDEMNRMTWGMERLVAAGHESAASLWVAAALDEMEKLPEYKGDEPEKARNA